MIYILFSSFFPFFFPPKHCTTRTLFLSSPVTHNHSTKKIQTFMFPEKHTLPLHSLYVFFRLQNLLCMTIVLKACKISRIWEISPSPFPVSYQFHHVFLKTQNLSEVTGYMNNYCFSKRERAMLFLLAVFLICCMHISVQNCLPQLDLMAAKMSHANLHKYTYASDLSFFSPVSFRSSTAPSPKSSSIYYPLS